MRHACRRIWYKKGHVETTNDHFQSETAEKECETKNDAWDIVVWDMET